MPPPAPFLSSNEPIKSPKEIYQLLISKNPIENKVGYEAFLRRTHWLTGKSPENLKKYACQQLNVKERDVIVSLKYVEPAFLWASQDGLESAKLVMVEAAYKYIQSIGDQFPPIVVWNFFDSQKMRMIIHDGHHRAYFYHRIRKRVQVVLLEPIGNYNIVEDKFRYAFQIQKRVIDLPVSRTRDFSVIIS
ncbi:MAG: hypothetical protein DRO88_05640 [Promethearchaeia archaeon]|nr:MAG: hypothetical protein DRO88_05640 [Candidatus Lokiarchaeia archaeon]